MQRLDALLRRSRRALCCWNQRLLHHDAVLEPQRALCSWQQPATGALLRRLGALRHWPASQDRGSYFFQNFTQNSLTEQELQKNSTVLDTWNMETKRKEKSEAIYVWKGHCFQNVAAFRTKREPYS